jgi:hypothetical protein
MLPNTIQCKKIELSELNFTSLAKHKELILNIALFKLDKIVNIGHE